MWTVSRRRRWLKQELLKDVLRCLVNKEQLLGMSTRLEVDAFLKAKGIDLLYDENDFDADRQTHEQLRRDGKLNVS